MAVINRDPRELNVQVYLSAIGMTDTTIEKANYAFTSALADPQNVRPLNFDYSYNEDRPFSKAGVGLSETRLGRKVKFLPSAQSANIVEVATHMTASSCTFAYGGIWQDEQHPVFDLLYGPSIEDYTNYAKPYGQIVPQPVLNTVIQGLTVPNVKFSYDYSSSKGLIPFINFSQSDILSIIVVPSIVIGGSSNLVSVQIKLKSPANLGGQKIDISTNDASVVVPSFVVVPSGATSIKFNVSTKVVSSDKAVIITASSSGNSKSTVLVLRTNNRTATPPNLNQTSADSFASSLISTEAAERTTYNIWHIFDVNKNPITSDTIKYEGPIVDTITSPTIRTIRDGVNGSSVYVNTKNKTSSSKIARIFPTSKDAIFYEEPLSNLNKKRNNYKAKIFYPTIIKQTSASDTKYLYDYFDYDEIDSIPSDNVGFHIKFENIDIGGPDSKIILTYLGVEELDKIYKLEIELVSNQIPKVTTTHKDSSGIITKTYKQLRSPIFGSRTYFDIFIHFVGPTLLVGFENDQSNWNSIFSTDYTSTVKNINDPNVREWKGIEFKFAKDQSYVSMDVSNTNFTFKYSTIIFDNYTYDKNNFNPNSIANEWKDSYHGLKNTADVTYNSLITKNHILMKFKTKTDEAFKKTVSEDDLIQSLITNKFMSLSYPNKYNSSSINNGGVSVFGDWRNTEINNNLDAFGGNSVFRYKQLASKTTGNLLETFGKLIFNGTIEGPVFLGLKNTIPDNLIELKPFSTEDLPFLKVIEKGDISSFVTGSINVSVSADQESDNLSYISKSTNIELSNLDFSPDNYDIGWRILDLIERNVIVVTVNAGYGNNLDNYFQGVITNVQTSRTGKNSSTTINCQDLGSYLLENLFFTDYVAFTQYKFRDIFKAIMHNSGFYEYFNILNQDYIANIDDVLSSNPAENQQILLANPLDRILDRLKQFLNKLITVPVNNTLKGQPTFRYEPRKGFLLDARWAPVNTDELRFTGIGTFDSYKYFIDSTPEFRGTDPGWHGLLTDAFSISTNTAPLASNVQTFGNTILNGYIAEETDKQFEDNALSVSQLNKIVNSLTNNDNVPHGYVGFRKSVKDSLAANETFSADLLRFKHEQNVKICQYPFHELKFNVYVTKPLKHHGTFVIKQFVNEKKVEDYIVTDKYIYQNCTYSINKSQNLITADITGVRQPWTIRELRIQNSE